MTLSIQCPLHAQYDANESRLIDEMLVSFRPNPPATRHDQDGDRNPRVLATFHHMLTLLSDDASRARVIERVVRLNDHKGVLEVSVRVPLNSSWEAAFRRAWEKVGGECEEMVEFIYVV